MRVLRPANIAALIVDFSPDPVGLAGEDLAVGVLNGTSGAEDRVEAEDRVGGSWGGGLVGHFEVVSIKGAGEGCERVLEYVRWVLLSADLFWP